MRLIGECSARHYNFCIALCPKHTANKAMTFFLSLLVIHLVALMTPGPDFFFVTQTAVSRSRIEALCGVAGITLGVTFWAGLSLIGLQWVFEQFAWLHRGLLFAGGLYLLWMAYNLLKGALKKPVASAGGAHKSELPVSRMRAFLMGLFTNLANAKAVIYFSSIFSMLLSPDMSVSLRWTIFAVVIAETFLWFSTVALIFGLPAMRRGYMKAARFIDGTAGALFGVFGALLLWEARR